MLQEEGLESVFARRARYAAATRAAVAAWGLEILRQDPQAYSNVLTAVVTPPGHDADHLRALILDRYDMSLEAGLSKLKGRVFRIGHVGTLNDLTLIGAGRSRDGVKPRRRAARSRRRRRRHGAPLRAVCTVASAALASLA